jgi:serine/threonine-protein phosphatase 2B regulatory subunit
MGNEGSKAGGKGGRKGKRPVEPNQQEYNRISQETKFTEPELKRLWQKFLALSGSQVADGKIDVAEFQSALGLKNEAFAARVFSAFDRDGSHEIDFAEFARGVSAMSPRATLPDKARFCFNVYDADGNGEIDREELRSILLSSLAENSAVKLSDDQLLKIIDRTYDKMDKNGDGGISFTEFQNEAMKNPTILACVNLGLDTLLGTPTA